MNLAFIVRKGALKSSAPQFMKSLELERQGVRLSSTNIMVHAHPVVIGYDLEEHQSLAVLDSLKKQIIVKPRGSFHQEQYDIFGHNASVDKNKEATDAGQASIA